jgi:hypothetical protein
MMSRDIGGLGIRIVYVHQQHQLQQHTTTTTKITSTTTTHKTSSSELAWSVSVKCEVGVDDVST